MNALRWLPVMVLPLWSVVPDARAAGLQDENLLATVPPGYKVGYTAHNERTQLTEFVPNGETVDDWSDMITIRIDHNLRADPDAYSKKLGTLWKKSCPGGESQKVTSGNENGYPFALWIYVCSLNPETGKPETMTMKTIAGDDSFYQAQVASRKAADADVVRTAAEYLRTVSVCDTRKTDRACPPGM